MEKSLLINRLYLSPGKHGIEIIIMKRQYFINKAVFNRTLHALMLNIVCVRKSVN